MLLSFWGIIYLFFLYIFCVIVHVFIAFVVFILLYLFLLSLFCYSSHFQWISLKFGLSVVILLAYRVCACLSKQLCISRYRLTNCYRNPANNHQKKLYNIGFLLKTTITSLKRKNTLVCLDIVILNNMVSVFHDCLSLSESWGRLEPILADIGREARYSLDK